MGFLCKGWIQKNLGRDILTSLGVLLPNVPECMPCASDSYCLLLHGPRHSLSLSHSARSPRCGRCDSNDYGDDLRITGTVPPGDRMLGSLCKLFWTRPVDVLPQLEDAPSIDVSAVWLPASGG
jgi:hypothetical protein